MSFDAAALRAQFPIFAEKINGRPLHYLDNGATAQMPQSVIDAVSFHESHARANVLRGVHTLVCLLERSELYELGLAEEAQTCEDQGIQFVYYPIEDISTPKDERSFLKLIQDLEERIGRSEKVVIHCRMGIGRSSVVAAAVLIRKGFPKEAVFDHISDARELSVPDTEEQREWVMRMDF